jgi:hypothetical protein
MNLKNESNRKNIGLMFFPSSNNIYNTLNISDAIKKEK